MKAALGTLFLVAFVIEPAEAQSVPDTRAALQQYYTDYLTKMPWGPATEATTFKSFYLGQRVTVGDGTPFILCKAIKDVNGENICAAADFRRFVCPFTPPVVTCTGYMMNSNTFTAKERDAALSLALTAFGDDVRPSVQIALDDWYPDSAKRRISGRVLGIVIRAQAPSPNFVPTAIAHFNRATGRQPQITIDQKDKNIISRQCKLNMDKLFAGRAKKASDVSIALDKCETDSLEKFLISTTRSVYYAWSSSDPGLPQNKTVSMGVDRDLTGDRVIIGFSYKANEAGRELNAKVEALAATAKAAEAKRTKEDF